MAFQMKVSNEKLTGAENPTPGPYKLKLLFFKPETSKKGDSINLKACMEVVDHVTFDGRKVWDNLNSNGAWTYSDFCHAFGLPMETDGKESWLPGNWDGDAAKFDPNKPETWKYVGPLVGRTANVEIGVDSFGAKIRRYFCAVPDCATKFPTVKHSQDLMKNSKG